MLLLFEDLPALVDGVDPGSPGSPVFISPRAEIDGLDLRLLLLLPLSPSFGNVAEDATAPQGPTLVLDSLMPATLV